MKTREIPLPLLAAIAATRGMLGVGIGLLLAPRLPEERRRRAGWVLATVGVVSTAPLLRRVLRAA